MSFWWTKITGKIPKMGVDFQLEMDYNSAKIYSKDNKNDVSNNSLELKSFENSITYIYLLGGNHNDEK